MRSPTRRFVVPPLLTLIAGVVLWGEALAAPKVIVTSGPAGSTTVVDVEHGTTTRSTCFTLSSADGTSRHLTLPGALRIDADGRFAWTSEQLGVIRDALALEGRESELAGVLTLHAPQAIIDGPTPFPRNGKPGDVLNPDCGKCLSGSNCSTPTKTQCCEHKTDDSCMACTVCTPKAIEVDVP